MAVKLTGEMVLLLRPQWVPHGQTLTVLSVKTLPFAETENSLCLALMVLSFTELVSKPTLPPLPSLSLMLREWVLNGKMIWKDKPSLTSLVARTDKPGWSLKTFPSTDVTSNLL
jgi:hypothetical protein